jgi:O-antigen/teichoic acid export membrane protein
MTPHRQNKLTRCILRVIDICVGIYLGRSVYWNEDPFRKATGTQWRVGWFFLAFFPIFLLAFTTNNSIQSFLDSAGDAGHSMMWLYIGLIGVVLIGILSLIKIGPKIPLSFSIPTAMLAWIYCIWLLGFHSEKIIHSP